MQHRPARNASVQKLVLVACAPFPLAIITTFALVLLVGERLPRQLTPGSGLWLQGFVFSALIAAMLLAGPLRGLGDRRLARLVTALCTVTSLMAWPVWTWGVLPSVNGARIGDVVSTRMTLQRLETTPVSRSRQLNHWAYLEPVAPDSPLRKARFFIPEETHDAWQQAATRSVVVNHAKGLLGAGVVLGITSSSPPSASPADPTSPVLH